MDDQKQNKDEVGNLPGEIRIYIEKRLELITLAVAEQVSLVAAEYIQKIVGLLFLVGGIFFLWFAIGYLIGEWLGSIGIGFLIASVPLFLGAYIFGRTKSKKITESVQAGLIQKSLAGVQKGLNLKPEEDKKEENNSEKK